MFRTSSAHLQEDIVVYKQHMVSSLSIRVLVACRYAARVITLEPYAACMQLCPPEDEHLMLEICRGEEYFMNI